jgi:hypothetical protein
MEENHLVCALVVIYVADHITITITKYFRAPPTASRIEKAIIKCPNDIP